MCKKSICFLFKQIPQCLPALASYLTSQASMLQSVKTDLENTKQQLQQAIGKFIKPV